MFGATIGKRRGIAEDRGEPYTTVGTHWMDS
jgi:hypothetical protein